jgi:hypothetical protein
MPVMHVPAVSRPRLPVLFVLLALAVLLIGAFRGASADQPPVNLLLSEATLKEGEVAAQMVAVAHPAVAALLGGNRGEVFNVFRRSAGCQSGDCYQVNIYDFERNGTITVMVDGARGVVESADWLPESQPAFSTRIQRLATEAILASADVADAIGFVPISADIELMQSHHIDSPNCNGNHVCIATVFTVDGGVVWVMYDGTLEQIDKIWWGERYNEDVAMRDYRPIDKSAAFDRIPEDCGVTRPYSRGGWSLNYLTLPSDGLEVSDVTFDDIPVAKSAKLIEWHARYPSGFGFVDYTGCSGGGGGFAIYPFGNTRIEMIMDNGEEIGFTLVQDFRMGSWPNSCNYRYEQHIQFFYDGRWRMGTWAYGRGCGNGQLNEATYRPVFRIDLDINGADNNHADFWNGTTWQQIDTEMWALQDEIVTRELYKYRFRHEDGTAWAMAPGQGQFADSGTGDAAWVYLTRFRTAEGANDLPSIGTCCNEDHRQGPHNYVNGESVADANIVLWYVSQSKTVTSWAVNQGLGEKPYCWADSTTSYWPCITGPMFYPIQDLPLAVGMGSTGASSPLSAWLPVVAGLLLLAVAGGIVWSRGRVIA